MIIANKSETGPVDGTNKRQTAVIVAINHHCYDYRNWAIKDLFFFAKQREYNDPMIGAYGCILHKWTSIFQTNYGLKLARVLHTSVYYKEILQLHRFRSCMQLRHAALTTSMQQFSQRHLQRSTTTSSFTKHVQLPNTTHSIQYYFQFMFNIYTANCFLELVKLRLHLLKANFLSLSSKFFQETRCCSSCPTNSLKTVKAELLRAVTIIL